jgi:hypothetical protein
MRFHASDIGRLFHGRHARQSLPSYLAGYADLRAGDWRISGLVGHTLSHIVDRAMS